MDSKVQKKVLISGFIIILVYLLDSLIDKTFKLSYGTIKTWLLLVLIVSPVLLKEKLKTKRWLTSILFAILWAVFFPLSAYLMETEFSLVRALLMGVVGFTNTFLQLR